MIDITYPIEDGPGGLVKTLDRVNEKANIAARCGYQLLVLSDRRGGPKR